MRVMTVLGTRPEIIRLSRVMAELDATTDHVIVHTGQNYDYELNQIFFEDLGLREPDHFLEAAGASPVHTIGNVLSSSYEVMTSVAPDAVLVLGDTNSGLALYAAKRLRIPTFHMEAGNRCFDERVPEEINRRLIDHIADVNLPYSRHARDLLLQEGLPPDRIIVTGSPLFEVVSHYRPRIDASDILERLKVEPSRFFLVSLHREENVDDRDGIERVLSILGALWKTYGLPVIVSTHPRTSRRLEESGLSSPDGDIRFLKPFAFSDYVAMQMHAAVVLSDSGTIAEESAILGFPAVNVRETHERHEGMENAIVPMSGLDADAVLRTVALVRAHGRGEEWGMEPPVDYMVPNVSKKVSRILHSYVDYVRRVVWRGRPSRAAVR